MPIEMKPLKTFSIKLHKNKTYYLINVKYSSLLQLEIRSLSVL